MLRSVEPELVFHLSGLVTANPDRDLVLPTLDSLLVSTVNTLVAVDEAGCRRVVLAGSLNEPGGEVDAPVPSSPYAAAKWAAGAYARMFHQLYETPLVTARTFMTYGPQPGRTQARAAHGHLAAARRAARPLQRRLGG